MVLLWFVAWLCSACQNVFSFSVFVLHCIAHVVILRNIHYASPGIFALMVSMWQNTNEHMIWISGWSSRVCMWPASCPSPCLPDLPFSTSNLDCAASPAATGCRWKSKMGLKCPLGPIANIRGIVGSLLQFRLQIWSTVKCELIV